MASGPLSPGPLLLAALGLLLSLPSPARAEGPEVPGTPEVYSHEDLINLPEPMIFDLVRLPDGAPGELEVNALVTVPLRKRPRVLWSPEVEYTFLRGQSIEVQTDLDAERLARVQLAFQSTLGFTRNQRFIHGMQFLAAYNAERHLDASMVHMSAVRFTPRLSSWLFVGMRLEGPSELEATQVSLIANPSLYYRVKDFGSHQVFIVAVEANTQISRDHRSYIVVAEVEIDITPTLQLQVGIGPRWEDGRLDPVLVTRLTWTVLQ